MKLKPCSAGHAVSVDSSYQVRCQTCGEEGPRESRQYAAVDAWNAGKRSAGWWEARAEAAEAKLAAIREEFKEFKADGEYIVKPEVKPARTDADLFCIRLYAPVAAALLASPVEAE